MNKTALKTMGIERPYRRNFYKVLVIDAKGSPVSEKDVAEKATAKPNSREYRKQLREQGWTTTRVFQNKEYTEARTSYKTQVQNAILGQRKNVIARAFAENDLEVDPRIERSLKTLLPLFRDASENRTVVAFKRIVGSVARMVKHDQQAHA